MSNNIHMRKFNTFASHYLEGSSEQTFSYAINVSDVSDFKIIAPRWAYYRISGLKVTYLPHQSRPVANPVLPYDTFTPANTATSCPPMSVLWTSSEQSLSANDIQGSPTARVFLQGTRWSMFRKLKLPLIVGAQGNTGVDIKLPNRRTLVSTSDSDIKWGSIYYSLHGIDGDALDNNSVIALSFTFQYTFYVTFVKAI